MAPNLTKNKLLVLVKEHYERNDNLVWEALRYLIVLLLVQKRESNDFSIKFQMLTYTTKIEYFHFF